MRNYRKSFRASPSVLAQEGQRKVCDKASVSLKEKISETCHAE